MIDPLAAAIHAAGAPSLQAAALVFTAGVITSLGPCAAPRYVTIAAAAASGRASSAIGAYGIGVIVAFLTIGSAANAAASLFAWSSAAYALLGMAFVCAGVRSVLRAPSACDHAEPTSDAGSRSLGAVCLAGMASTLLVSPCCTPIVAALGAAASASGQPATGMLLIAAFGVGHTLPLVIAGCAGARFAGRLRATCAAAAPALVGGTLSIAVGIYYGLLVV